MKPIQKSVGEQGEVSALLLPLIMISILFLCTVGFGVWAFNSRQDYKNNSDAKVADAVAVDKQQVQAADAKQYAEAAKSPLVTYVGPDDFGSVHISYPKTWSAYVDTASGNYPLDTYFHPGFVPATATKQTYNLRVQVVANTYDREMSRYSTYVSTGSITAVPYSLPKVPSVIGTRLSGAIFPDTPSATGTIVLLPLRDKTLEIWTESNSYLADFNTYVLPNLTFKP